MQRDSVSTPRQRAPQGATNRAQLKASAAAPSAAHAPSPVATPRILAPPKSLMTAAAEASSRHPPVASRAQTAASAPADSRPRTMSSRSSGRSSRGGLRPCVRSIAHALKVSFGRRAGDSNVALDGAVCQVFGSDAVDAGDVAAALRDVGVVVDGRCSSGKRCLHRV